MRLAAILSLLVSGFSTFPAVAASTTDTPDKIGALEMPAPDQPTSLHNQLNPRIVPQLGMSSMQYTGDAGGQAGQAFSGGITTELGATKARLLETGVLLLQSSSEAKIGPGGSSQQVTTSNIAIPLMAKIRFIDTTSQAWYLKFGAMTTFQAASNYSSQTNSFDVLASAGVGARLPVSKKIDLLVEATYNRGMIDALQAHSGVAEGLLFFTGLSFGI